jgi:hypothetical protein
MENFTSKILLIDTFYLDISHTFTKPAAAAAGQAVAVSLQSRPRRIPAPSMAASCPLNSSSLISQPLQRGYEIADVFACYVRFNHASSLQILAAGRDVHFHPAALTGANPMEMVRLQALGSGSNIHSSPL